MKPYPSPPKLSPEDRKKLEDVRAGVTELEVDYRDLVERGYIRSSSLRWILTEPGAFVLSIISMRCHCWWREGVLQPPGEPEKPSGRCLLPRGHDGDHRFPGHTYPSP